MAANLYHNSPSCGSNTLYGDQVQHELEATGVKSPLFGIPTWWFYKEAIEEFIPGATVTHYTNATVFDLKSAIAQDKIVIVAVSWQTDGEILSDPFHSGVGHYMVAVGYDENNIHLLDSAAQGNNGGVSTVSYSDFTDMWINKSNSFITSGSMFTISPP